MRSQPAHRALQFALETPWAITEGALQTILEIAAREHDVEAGVQAIAAKLGQPVRGTETASIRNGIATIPVAGPLFRYANLFTAISGATSYEVLATDLTQALEDPAVGAIVLMIDSPGGTVNGLSEMGEIVHASRGRKPIVAMVSDMSASAAYLIASAADAVIASPMAVLGSIGVRVAYQDTRQRDEARGVRTIEIISSQSPRKAMDPTEDAGRADLQAVADSLAQVLIETVARNRGVSEAHVLARFGQGGVLVGQAAVDAGLADRVATYETVHAELAAGRFPPAAPVRSIARGQVDQEDVQATVDRLLVASGRAPVPKAAEITAVPGSLEARVQEIVSYSNLRPRRR